MNDVVIPEFEEINKLWFFSQVPQYKYVLPCLEFGRAKTHETLTFSHGNIKFLCLFDYFFGFDPVNGLKTVDVKYINTFLYTRDNKPFLYDFSDHEKIKIECIVLQYVDQYFK
jgi:hypothetical protein